MVKCSNQRLDDLARMSYAEYLQSPEWKRIRRKIVKRDGSRCRLCNRDTRIDVHHRHYSARGKEHPDDLISLCHECHEIFHMNTSSPALFKGEHMPVPAPVPVRAKNEPDKPTAFAAHLWLPPLPDIDMDSCRLCAKAFTSKRKSVMYVAGNIPVCRECYTDYADMRDEIYRVRNANNPKSVYVIRRVEFVTNLVSYLPNRELMSNLSSMAKSVARKTFQPDGYTDKIRRADEDYAFDKAMYGWWERMADPHAHFPLRLIEQEPPNDEDEPY